MTSMRILHIVTLVSPDGEYGGPVRVAENLSGELVRRGHEVTVVAGRAANLGETGQFGTSRLILFRPFLSLYKRSHVLTMSLSAMWWAWRRRGRFDVIHVHLARDLFTGPVAWLAAGRTSRVVVQSHGMLMPRTGLVYRIFDSFTIKPVLAQADTVLYLTDRERGELESQVPSHVPLQRLENGVPLTEGGTARTFGADSETLEFLFLSRLHERKRPLDFVRAAAEVSRSGATDASFALVGPDGGSASEVTAAIAAEGLGDSTIRWEGPIEPGLVQQRLASADVFVLPSVAEPFPMAVLEAMSAGLPVIITNECGLAGLVTEFDAGIVIEPGSEPLTQAMTSLIGDPDRLAKLSVNALAAARSLSVEEIGGQLSEIYTR